ncbi:MAG TPA: hypothetical protein VKZ18_11730 [Polyangia bacterium]|nr:hypothetical protein [Polyangia bacterium]
MIFAALTARADVHADLVEVVGELCWIATVAHYTGDCRRRDEVVDLAGELAAQRTAGLAGAH